MIQMGRAGIGRKPPKNRPRPPDPFLVRFIEPNKNEKTTITVHECNTFNDIMDIIGIDIWNKNRINHIQKTRKWPSDSIIKKRCKKEPHQVSKFAVSIYRGYFNECIGKYNIKNNDFLVGILNMPKRG